MKVATTKDTANPNELRYVEIEAHEYFQIEGFTFALHPSYNSLLKCYMLSEYATGYVLSAFSASVDEPDMECLCERSIEFIKKINIESLVKSLHNVPEVNSAVLDNVQSLDAIDEEFDIDELPLIKVEEQ